METIPLKPHAQFERENYRQNSDCGELWDLLDQVKDPEIPVISIWDLGILRDIEITGEHKKHVLVTITPTYSGCPAMDAISSDIKKVLDEAGYTDTEVKSQLAPAWTTDWMSSEGRNNLRNYGIAPPEDTAEPLTDVTPENNVTCPQCRSSNTKRISEFGSTACKALFQCNDCNEPFDYFKHI